MKRISVSIPDEMYGRLIDQHSQMVARTGFPLLSVSAVAAVAMDDGLKIQAKAAEANNESA